MLPLFMSIWQVIRLRHHDVIFFFQKIMDSMQQLFVKRARAFPSFSLHKILYLPTYGRQMTSEVNGKDVWLILLGSY